MATNAPAWQRLEYDERRTQILESARQLFAERPYDEISTTDIAQGAGVTRGLLYHYFPRKRDIYIEVVRQAAASLPALFQPRHGMPAAAAAAANIEDFLDFVERNREVWLAAVNGGIGRDAEAEAIVDHAREAIVDRILRRPKGAAKRSAAERFVARSYLGLVEAACREWLQHGRADRADVHRIASRALPRLLADRERTGR
jgi:AcrR family transcriptional regulator